MTRYSFTEEEFIKDTMLDEEKIKKLFDARKTGELVRKFLKEEVQREVATQVFDILRTNNDRDIRIFHLMAQMDSMEKSIKDTNRKITAIRNQLRKENGRKEVK